MTATKIKHLSNWSKLIRADKKLRANLAFSFKGPPKSASLNVSCKEEYNIYEQLRVPQPNRNGVYWKAQGLKRS